MITRYNVTLRGTSMASLDPSILILDIQHHPVSQQDDVLTLAKRQGTILQRSYVDKCSVTITFQIRKYDIAERQTVCSKIAKWVIGGGVLITNDRPNQKLTVDGWTLPVIPSALRWTDPLQLTFIAYAIPYWEATNAPQEIVTGTRGGADFEVPGNVKNVPCEMRAVVTGDTAMTRITFTVNNRSLMLSGLNAAKNSTLQIMYDSKMIQYIKIGTTSLLDKRTGVDDLLCDCGATNYFNFSSNTECRVYFLPRGWWY